MGATPARDSCAPRVPIVARPSLPRRGPSLTCGSTSWQARAVLEGWNVRRSLRLSECQSSPPGHVRHAVSGVHAVDGDRAASGSRAVGQRPAHDRTG